MSTELWKVLVITCWLSMIWLKGYIRVSFLFILLELYCLQGIHLATDFVSRVRSEEQKSALFQVVEDYRSRIKSVTKENLKLC